VSSQVVHQLNREWQRHVDRHLEEPQRWAQHCRPLEGCSTLDDVLARVRPAPDIVLGFLIERARAGEEIAARTILQTMLGKLVLMAGSGRARQQPDALDDLVDHMWFQIRRYSLPARPRRIAANLVLDTLKAAHRDWRITDSPVEMATPPESVEYERELRPDLPDRVDASTQSLLHAALTLGLISATTRDLLLAVYGPEELSGRRAAERCGCSAQAIRSRCSRAVRELAPQRDLNLATSGDFFMATDSHRIGGPGHSCSGRWVRHL
jgi:DNA-directed RNA polymerase specialized sigma24 family protein